MKAKRFERETTDDPSLHPFAFTARFNARVVRPFTVRVLPCLHCSPLGLCGACRAVGPDGRSA